ncbi:hypothetical protein C1H46_036122 [Malus baccata]|uniref:DUF599 domain-containing protein n=1 Tax=Malus baccata TaxID=106549 RepID=A0A540KVS4_MALBA|nr:hypothetical protein C1H46_036122 [Malus baccata]
MEVLVYLDTILVPLSFFLLIGYHVYLWYTFKAKPSLTTIGIDSMRRRKWFLEIMEADGMKGMLVIQSLRNTQMVAIFTASTAIALSLTLAALTNNAYNASHLVIKSPFFGSQSGSIFALKYGLASILMLFSSLFSSMATGFLIDTIFLINACFEFSYSGITETQLEKGYMLALIGNRLLCISFPMLLWLFGPMLVALSSLALVWWLYELDFAAKLSTSSRQSLS